MRDPDTLVSRMSEGSITEKDGADPPVWVDGASTASYEAGVARSSTVVAVPTPPVSASDAPSA